jgi:CRP-like cAMP-binding protein
MLRALGSISGPCMAQCRAAHPARRHSARSFHTSTRSTLHTLFSKTAGTSTNVSANGSTASYLSQFLLRQRTLPLPRWVSPKHYTITLSECLGHASFLLVAASYATDDFILLRTIAVMGSTAMVFFVYFHPNGKVLWLPFKWNLLFIVINIYRIGHTYYDTFVAQRYLPPLYQQIREDHYWNVDPVDFYKLFQLAREEVLRPGDVVCRQGDMNPYIRLVIRGQLDVLRDGVKTYPLEEGNFVSESGLHAGLMLTGTVEANCTIVAAPSPSQDTILLLQWDRTQLMQLLQQEKHLRNSLKAALTWDIVRKLKGQRQMLARHEVPDAELWTVKRNEQNEDRYAAILQNMLTHPEYFRQRKRELDKYRIIHHIDDEHHRLALKKCGWTEEEYALGIQVMHAQLQMEEHQLEDEEGRVESAQRVLGSM